jgi:hypothetical protein
MARIPKKIKVLERKLGQEHALGQAWMDTLEIEIDPRQRSKVYLNTLIHEALHIADPKMSETKVRKLSGILTQVLWQQNFRRIMK